MRFLRNQSGAMFGLDARIALGIFAILAVVASVVAYGRIASAKQAVLLSDLQAIEDAMQAYQADMGTFYLFTIRSEEGAEGIHDLEALWDKERVLPGFQPHWNGPYLHRNSRQYQQFGRFTLLYAQKDRKSYCSTDSECFIWLALPKVPAKTWEEVNATYDETRDKKETTGEDISNGRVQADALTDPRMLLIRTISRPQ